MSETICLDKNYSTTRQVTRKKNEVSCNREEILPTQSFLPQGEGRQGEGGLRTKGFFKTSYTNKPLISVITVVYNNEKYLKETIKSVINQTYDNVEYIIIDGGSTDGTLDVIKKYEAQIDYWVSEPDQGLYDAMNKAILASSGTWLNFMNSGDMYSDQHSIKHAIEYADSNVDVIYSDLYLYSDSHSKIRRIACNAESLFVVHQSMIYKRVLHEKHGLYLVHKNLTISDYLFFNLLDRNKFEGGISSNLGHIREKFAVDYLFNNMGLLKMVLHVIYALTKKIFFKK